MSTREPQVYYDSVDQTVNNDNHLPAKEVRIVDPKSQRKFHYKLMRFEKNHSRQHPILVRYDYVNNIKGSIEITAKKVKIEIWTERKLDWCSVLDYFQFRFELTS